jgi:hypothetical protein
MMQQPRFESVVANAMPPAAQYQSPSHRSSRSPAMSHDMAHPRLSPRTPHYTHVNHQPMHHQQTTSHAFNQNAQYQQQQQQRAPLPQHFSVVLGYQQAQAYSSPPGAQGTTSHYHNSYAGSVMSAAPNYERSLPLPSLPSIRSEEEADDIKYGVRSNMGVPRQYQGQQ